MRSLGRMGQRLDVLLRGGADMKTTWTDPSKPGVPMNPEKDGRHWLIRVNGQYPEVWEWASGPDGWCAEYGDKGIGAWCESEGDGQPEEIAKWYHYIGPVLMPDEVQNLRDNLASAERERAHQQSRADRNAAEHAREQAKREALQARVAKLDGLAYGLMLAMSASGHDFTDILREARAALTGGKDE